MPSIPDSRYWNSSLSQWNLDSGFQSLVGFRILWTVFRIPRPRISVFTLSKFLPDFGFHEQNFPHSGIRNPDFLTWGEMWQNRNSYFVDCRLSHLRKKGFRRAYIKGKTGSSAFPSTLIFCECSAMRLDWFSRTVQTYFLSQYKSLKTKAIRTLSHVQ